MALRFDHFASRLRRHIRMEEEIFFPAFEERTGMRGAGPTAMMRSEHRQIEAMLDRLTRATADPDRAAAAKALAVETGQLFAFLQSHDRKEEGVPYPMADRVVSDADRRRLIEKMRAL
jgi:regulator of cell morphogenesis and NO signaling